jgi:DNA transformation protein and related proteins
MSVSPSYKAFVIEQLSAAGPVTARSMFGGVGLYCHGLFFALIDDDTLYLKVDDATRPEFERLGSQPFRPFGDDSHVMQYYELPADVLEDRAAVRPWVDRALDAARRKASGKRRRPNA